MDAPFHDGERAVQARAGVEATVERWAPRALRDHLPETHRQFYASLPFAVLAARDEAARPWVTLLVGSPGFVNSPDPRRLRIAAQPGEGDPLRDACTTGRDVGLLGIDLSTRRRNRVNGSILSADAAGFELGVAQAYGNCPQHIRPRTWQWTPAVRESVRRTYGLTAEQRRFIARADTFFIASGFRGEGDSRAFGMDASHRGGPPGLVRVDDARTLAFPDYPGNNLFNTLGNLTCDPRVGLCFVDFTSCTLLQLTGTSRIDWSPVDAERQDGVARWVHIAVEEVVERPSACGGAV